MAAAEKEKKDVKKEDEEGEKEKAPEKKKSSSLTLIIIIVVILLVLAGGGGAAYFFLIKNKQQTTEKKPVEQEKPQVSVFLPMDPFIVNLIDNESERYLKVIMQLELSDQKLVEELTLLKPRLRDSIIDLLSSKTYKDMLDPNGKQRLRDEIVMRANTISTKGKVLKVYFTEFVIQ